MDFFYFLVLVTNSPLITSWDYLQNEPPSPKPSSQHLLVGNYARIHRPHYELQSLHTLCLLHRFYIAWWASVSFLPHSRALYIQASPWHLGHLSWVPVTHLDFLLFWSIYFISGNFNLISNHVYLFPRISLWILGIMTGVSGFPPWRLQNPLCVSIPLLQDFPFFKPRLWGGAALIRLQ